MSTTVTYKGSTIATADNNTKVLKTAGTYLEDDITLVDTSSGGGGADYTRTEICPTTTFSVASAGGYTALTNSARLTDATDYIVTYDGTEYVCTSRELWGSDRFLGDIALTWSQGAQSDYINPFCVEDWNGNNEPVVYARDTSSHTIKIERLDLLNDGVTLLQKTITANGTYDPADDNADGYSEITVSVSGGTPRTSADLTVSGATVTAPAGVYASDASKSVASGTAGTPTATKGSVSNHAITVTPSVTNTTGYITGGTLTGTAVSVAASELVSGSETKTANGTYDVTNLASLVVNVSGGSGNFTSLGTLSVGSISTSSTTDTDTGKSITVKGIYNYDLLVCECSVDTKTNNRHAATTRLVWLTAGSDITTKNGATFATATWNCKLSSSGVATTRSNTTAYGVYAKACTVSAGNTGDNGQAVITIYQRYNSTQTGTINGTYTMRVYGVKIYDLIGG